EKHFARGFRRHGIRKKGHRKVKAAVVRHEIDFVEASLEGRSDEPAVQKRADGYVLWVVDEGRKRRDPKRDCEARRGSPICEREATRSNAEGLDQDLFEGTRRGASRGAVRTLFDYVPGNGRFDHRSTPGTARAFEQQTVIVRKSASPGCAIEPLFT